MTSDADSISLVASVVRRRNRSLLWLMNVIGTRLLTTDEREQLRGEMAAELSEFGLGAHDEPTSYGLDLEAAIDWLGRQ